MKVYVTKYALTGGIQVWDAEPSFAREERLYAKGQFSGVTLGKDAFKTYDEALKAADAMREKKIAQLNKQVKKLRALTFPKEPPQ